MAAVGLRGCVASARPGLWIPQQDARRLERDVETVHPRAGDDLDQRAPLGRRHVQGVFGQDVGIRADVVQPGQQHVLEHRQQLEAAQHPDQPLRGPVAPYAQRAIRRFKDQPGVLGDRQRLQLDDPAFRRGVVGGMMRLVDGQRRVAAHAVHVQPPAPPCRDQRSVALRRADRDRQPARLPRLGDLGPAGGAIPVRQRDAIILV